MRPPRRALVTWAGLVAATLVSVGLAAHHGAVVPLRVAAPLVLVVAWVKVWCVGTEFMELRAAPRWLRWSAASWIVVVGLATTTLAAL